MLPRRNIASADQDDVLPLEEAMVLLAEAEEDRTAAAATLREMLARLGLSFGTYPAQHGEVDL
jgi:type I restriction enzyme M protein